MIASTMPRLGKAALVFVGLVAAAQLVPVERTNPSVTSDVPAPPEVKALLRRACYNCHSHETVWPWYSAVAPVSWLVGHDVQEGRDELDFSAWDAYRPQKKIKKLKKSAEEIAEAEMPPWYYRVMHPESRLAAADQERLRAWTAEEIGKLSR